MNPFLVLLTVILFLMLDLLLRLALRRFHGRRHARELREALEGPPPLNISEETPSLRRVELKDPLARVLGVAGEESVLDALRKGLVMAGYSVDTVESGEEALKLVRDEDYDLVFADLRLSTLRGVDVVRAIHHLRPSSDIVVITSFATAHAALDCMKYGAADYVEKPFSEEDLERIAGNCLLRRQERRSGEPPDQTGEAP
jgi:CheY-like chemotaxis protein